MVQVYFMSFSRAASSSSFFFYCKCAKIWRLIPRSFISVLFFIPLYYPSGTHSRFHPCRFLLGIRPRLRRGLWLICFESRGVQPAPASSDLAPDPFRSAAGGARTALPGVSCCAHSCLCACEEYLPVVLGFADSSETSLFLLLLPFQWLVPHRPVCCLWCLHPLTFWCLWA